MSHLSIVIEVTILVLAIFLGFEVISKVPAMLHTPLMSGTNFIHGIVIVGAIIILGTADDTLLKIVGFIAMVLATANVVGGWFVTDRMLEMFKRRPEPTEGREAVISDANVVGVLYLVAIVCFILALRFLSSPKHARKGNWVGGVGMLVAIIDHAAARRHLQLVADRRRRAVGSVVGFVGARRVKMTAMPQMVALFNGVGGGAAALVAIAEFHRPVRCPQPATRPSRPPSPP